MTITLFIIAFVISAILSLVFIKLGARGLFLDEAKGVQKHHHKITPRIGGIAIFMGIFCGGLYLLGKGFAQINFWLVIVGLLPIFCGGVIEDYTRKTSPIFRLLLALISTAIVFFVLDVQLRSVRIPWIDIALTYTLVSFLFTLFAVSGLTNSINIIDGYNGLSGMVSLFILSALLCIALKFHDFFLINICVLSIGAIVGFLIWNYPHGLIFLGDSGAYLIGFVIATISIMLVNNHSEVSPWFPLLLCIYPVWETVFSMFRRKFIQKKSMMDADALHLHTLIYKRILRGNAYECDVTQATLRNSMTSVYSWMLCLLTIIPAVVFWNQTLILGLFALLFICFYLWLYSRIIKFKTPRFLIINRDREK
ncbi:MAG: glycosyltransferase family 4 protein [Deltaproteobacteria bacterium]